MTGSLRFFLRTIPLLDFGLWTKLMGEGSGLRIWFPNFGWDLFSNEHLWDTLCSFWSLIPESCVWTIVWVLERVWRGWAWLLPENITQLAFYFLFFCILYSIGFYVLVNIICDTSDLIIFMNVMSESLVWLNFMSTRAFLRSLSFLFEFLFAFPKSRMIWSWKVAKPSHSSKLS